MSLVGSVCTGEEREEGRDGFYRRANTADAPTEIDSSSRTPITSARNTGYIPTMMGNKKVTAPLRKTEKSEDHEKK